LDTEEDRRREETSEAFSRSKGDWLEPPVWPTDLFAVAAHVIHASGLLTYFHPDPDHTRAKGARPISFTLSIEERERAQEAGNAWSENSTTPPAVYRLWDTLISAWSERVRASSHTQNNQRKNAPRWWAAAMQLLIIADNACVGIGAPPSIDFPDRWLVDAFQAFYAKPFVGIKKLAGGGYRAKRQLSTFGIESDPDVACVQPKNRIAAVGCNLRNLTKNAAYVPHAGHVRCHWHQPINSMVSEDGDTLDILIVPLPLIIEDAWIEKSATSEPDAQKRPNWGNFDIHQRWLDDEDGVVSFVSAEVEKARNATKDGSLNGIVFPEYALTEPLFNKICDAIKQLVPELEFAITGSSSNCDDESGNFVLTAIWKNKVNKQSQDSRYLLTSRRKHHRWRLSTDQIENYGLQKALPPPASWWENHSIAQREIHFFHFRKTSVFTTMICEDLARSDPCHDILRSVGPNLLFALLMDGPQIKDRWPARYASTLADDPGTSVLTVTSMGLIERSNVTGLYPRSRVIAMWRDETGKTQELSLDDGCNSMMLSLKAVSVIDQTLDGRKSDRTWSWRYEDHKSLPGSITGTR
jgi:hypothetical protein